MEFFRRQLNLRGSNVLFLAPRRRILDRWDRRLEHQQQLESRGLTYAFRIALAGLTVSLITILAGIVTGQTGGIVAGGAVGTIDLVALVYAFIRASSR